MLNDELTGLLKEFKVRAENDLTKARTDGKQTRSLVVGPPKLVTLTADKCKKLCEKAGLTYGNGYENRVLEYITTNEQVDRYGDIVRNKEMDFTTNYFPNNPVMMYIHNYKMHPIGNSIKIWRVASEKVIRAYGLFADPATDITWVSELAYRMAKAGFMRACSIGFLPKTWNSPNTQEERDKLSLGKWGIEYLISEYLEWSPCGIPANPGALNNYLEQYSKEISFEEFDEELLDKMLEVKIFPDDNTLDIFSEHAKGRVDLTIVTPEIDIETEGTSGSWKYCVCKKCKYSKKHTAGKPCGKCPKCGEQMSGSNTKPKKDVDETETYLIEYVKEGNKITDEVEAVSWEDAESKATEEYGETVEVIGQLIDDIPFNKDGKELKSFCTEWMSLGFKHCNSIRATSWEEAQKIADDSELTDELVVGVIGENLLLDFEGNEVGKAGDQVKANEPLFSVLDDEEKFCQHFNVTDVKDFKFPEKIKGFFTDKHACSLVQGKLYSEYKIGIRKCKDKSFQVIVGKTKDNKWEQCFFVYTKSDWSIDEAKNHYKDYKCVSFEPASEKEVTENTVKLTQPTVNINLDSNELTNAIKEFTKAVNKFADIVDKSKPEAQQAAASVDDDEDYTSDSGIQLDKLETDINI